MFMPKKNIPTPLHAYRLGSAERGAASLMRKDESLRNITPYAFGAGEVGSQSQFKTAPSVTNPTALNRQPVGEMLRNTESDEAIMSRLSQTRPTRGQSLASMEGSSNPADQIMAATQANINERRQANTLKTQEVKKIEEKAKKAQVETGKIIEERQKRVSKFERAATFGTRIGSAMAIKDKDQRKAAIGSAVAAVSQETVQKGIDAALSNLGLSKEVSEVVGGPITQGLTAAGSALISGSPRGAARSVASGGGAAAGGAAGMAIGGPVGAAVGSAIGATAGRLIPGTSGSSNFMGRTARAGGLKTAAEMLRG
tara:strand:- start:6012 stop:6947 length:936 start_codon:yes stop_codon:yes gene_type:complete